MPRGRNGGAAALPARLGVNVDAIISDVRSSVPTLTPRMTKRVIQALRFSAERISEFAADLDPVKEPRQFFDPADPRTIGTIVAVALLMQRRIPLKDVRKSYGSGVYAIYYDGAHPAYAAISGTETPIYLGKADPEEPDARTPREQGTKLADRLIEHRGTIADAEAHAVGLEGNVRIAVSEFSCRMLVVSSLGHLSAERQLIDLFKPIWNSEVKICFGMSKHGDREARLNSRSPWHVLHPGVDWALNPKLKDAKSSKQIVEEIAAHLAQNPPYTDIDHAVMRLITRFSQHEAEIDIPPNVSEGDDGSPEAPGETG